MVAVICWVIWAAEELQTHQSEGFVFISLSVACKERKPLLFVIFLLLLVLFVLLFFGLGADFILIGVRRWRSRRRRWEQRSPQQLRGSPLQLFVRQLQQRHPAAPPPVNTAAGQKLRSHLQLQHLQQQPLCPVSLLPPQHVHTGVPRVKLPDSTWAHADLQHPGPQSGALVGERQLGHLWFGGWGPRPDRDAGIPWQHWGSPVQLHPCPVRSGGSLRHRQLFTGISGGCQRLLNPKRGRCSWQWEHCSRRADILLGGATRHIARTGQHRLRDSGFGFCSVGNAGLFFDVTKLHGWSSSWKWRGSHREQQRLGIGRKRGGKFAACCPTTKPAEAER